ncbi:hypothetical protein AOC36_07505 [Erysipelothrix larvae]|uniref:Abasic site processing protein n=1 Tax=Erysipelothrix larvae TaxID=1514105 RepID=A0A0X8H0H6_9FIRM|nr:SOS response-associated peptidase family protein [Erysipelothrix larvae]AMC93835.1 hypothetical protein AOC36_07505 [Erysipelothrix larvae]
MCGRVFISKETEERLERYMDPYEFEKVKLGEVFPGDTLAIQTREAPLAMKWGVKPEWSKSMLINARIETIAEKPFFKQEFKTKRCVVMASSYFEWKREESINQKYQISIEAPLIYLAGILKEEKGEHKVIILTEPCQDTLAWMHDRMPVILSNEEVVAYLNGKDDILTQHRHHTFIVEKTS